MHAGWRCARQASVRRLVVSVVAMNSAPDYSSCLITVVVIQLSIDDVVELVSKA